MTRKEQIVGFILGAALFCGLFYFIYTTWKAAPEAPVAEDMTTMDDYADEEELPAEEAPAVENAPEAKAAPAAAAPAPAPAPAEKK
jgi:hypothetical protein